MGPGQATGEADAEDVADPPPDRLILRMRPGGRLTAIGAAPLGAGGRLKAPGAVPLGAGAGKGNGDGRGVAPGAVPLVEVCGEEPPTPTTHTTNLHNILPRFRQTPTTCRQDV